MIGLVGRGAMETRVRAILVIPIGKQLKLSAEGLAAKWHEDDARTLALQAQDESLDNRDAAVLANGTESGCDAFEIAPAFEHVTPELLALVADHVFRCGACLMNRVFEEVLNRSGRGIVPECLKAHHASGAVVNDDRQPPTKWPALR